MRYLEILAEDAAHGAVGEEDGARPARAREHRLFAVVRENGIHLQPAVGPAVTGFAGAAVFPAPAPAEVARCKPLISCFDLGGKFVFGKILIEWHTV
jgi:hypothetical protein